MKLSQVRPLQWAVIALLIIVLVAAALRLVGLADIPPGLYHDEAVNGLDAVSALRGERLPIFFERNGGREPLFIYLQALSIWLFGPSIEALRIVSALAGLATIPVFFLLARELTLPRLDATWLALIASAGLASSYWHLHWSRVGLRAILLPLLLCLSFYFFMRARRTRSTWSSVLAGLFLGLCMYSYLAARLVPLIYLVFILLDWRNSVRSDTDVSGSRATSVWTRLKPIALLFGTALVVFLPLGLYFVQYPNALVNRASDIVLTSSAETPVAMMLLGNIARVAGMFFVQGDVEWRHGLALRPVLDPIAAVLFVPGVLIAFRFWREAAAQLALLWLVVMLLPTILSEQAPDTLRAIGAVPIVFWFVAVGWMQFSEWLRARVGGGQAVWGIAGVALLLIGSGAFTVNDYFNRWANDARAYRDFDGEFTEIAQWINRQTEPVFVPLEIFAYPTVQYMTIARAGELASSSALSGAALDGGGLAIHNTSGDAKNPYVLVSDGQAILLNPSSVAVLGLTETLMGRYRNLTGVGRIDADSFEDAALPRVPVSAEFPGLRLIEYALDSNRISAGTPIGINLYWQRTGQLPHEPALLLELVDAQGDVVAQTQDELTRGISAARYPKEQSVPDRHLMTPENELPPGAYTLQMGLLDTVTGERWNFVRDGVESDSFPLQTLVVPLAAVTIPDSAARTEARWENGIALDAYARDSEEMAAGDSANWTLYWRSGPPLTQDLTVTVQLLDEGGNIVAQADHDPVGGNFPNSGWGPNEIVADEFTLEIPAGLAPGEYALYIGWYDRNSGERVSVNSPTADDNLFRLSTVTIR